MSHVIGKVRKRGPARVRMYGLAAPAPPCAGEACHNAHGYAACEVGVSIRRQQQSGR